MRICNGDGWLDDNAGGNCSRCPGCDACRLSFRSTAASDNYVSVAESFVNEECSCGGAGPDDPKACWACRGWHMLRPSLEALARAVADSRRETRDIAEKHARLLELIGACRRPIVGTDTWLRAWRELLDFTR